MNIKKLSPKQYEVVRHLFHKDDANLPAAFGVIEGLIPGQIWVDDCVCPTVCLIICEDPYCLIGGSIDINIFQEFFILLKSKKHVRLYCNEKTQIDFSTFGFSSIRRREYKYQGHKPNIPIYKNNTPYILKKIDNESTFDLCIWKTLMLEIYNTKENYLKNAIGFVLWDKVKQLVVSEIHGICSKQYTEIAAVTRENYRGQHLATILCNHFIHYVMKKGLQPIWSCDEQNIASWKVAERQQMKQVNGYKFYTK